MTEENRRPGLGDYRALLRDVRTLLEQGRQQAQMAAARVAVQTYWQVGERLEQAGAREAVLGDLAEDLGIDAATLGRAVQLYRRVPPGDLERNLTWSHYKYLLPIRDDRERSWYAALAERQALSVQELAQAIRSHRYRVEGRPPEERRQLRRPAEPTYVYKALVERVIDGDTLLLRVDLGFTVFKEQRMRLAQIDAEPLDSAEGTAATRFVEERLAGVDFVMVRTHKIDIYGRYVADVFYAPGWTDKAAIFARGRYLNQEIVDAGFARVV